MAAFQVIINGRFWVITEGTQEANRQTMTLPVAETVEL
jgi:hypothetical protein